MANILKRTIYADTSKGYIRWIPWAKVTTNHGCMWEPRTAINQYGLGGHKNLADQDFTDEYVRVDEIEYVEQGKNTELFSQGGGHVMGGITGCSGM
jgi:hypothetical protein